MLRATVKKAPQFDFNKAWTNRRTQFCQQGRVICSSTPIVMGAWLLGSWLKDHQYQHTQRQHTVVCCEVHKASPVRTENTCEKGPAPDCGVAV